MFIIIRNSLLGRRLLNALIICPIALLTGCTIVGSPPSFSRYPPSMKNAAAPRMPDALPGTHLQITLMKPESPEKLADVGKTAQQKNSRVIYYPTCRLSTETEVVSSQPKVSVELTASDDDLKKIVTLLKSGKMEIAILDFKNEAGAGGASGRLAADFFYRALKRNAGERNLTLKIQDRSEIFNTIQGEAKMDDATVALSQEEWLNKLKKMNYTGLILSGAVTDYQVENREFQFPYVIDEESFSDFSRAVSTWRSNYELYARQYEQNYLPAYNRYKDEFIRIRDENNDSYKEYEKNYTRYYDSYLEYSKLYRRYTVRLRRLTALGNIAMTGILAIPTDARVPLRARPAEKKPLIPKQNKVETGVLYAPYPKFQWPEELPEVDSEEVLRRNLDSFYQNKRWMPAPQSRIATVCNIGITYRFVDGQNSKIICIGNGGVRHISPQAGMKAVCDTATEEVFNRLLNE